MRDLASLPKAHLHLHLDGAIPEQTLSELCARGGIDPPALPTQRRYSSFGAFMNVITACHVVLSAPANLRRVIDEIVQDAAADGAVWLELSLWPGLFGGRLGSERRALEVAIDADTTAAARYGIGFGLMVAANRHVGPQAALSTARLAAGLAGEGVVSFGLDGDEACSRQAPFPWPSMSPGQRGSCRPPTQASCSALRVSRRQWTACKLTGSCTAYGRPKTRRCSPGSPTRESASTCVPDEQRQARRVRAR